LNLREAIALDVNTDALDMQLKGRSLGPQQSVHGWTLWECLDPHGCSGKPRRFSVIDASGTKHSGPCVPKIFNANEADPNRLPMGVLPGKIDLSNARATFMSSWDH
jgi:hypothetical protein